MKRMIIAVAVLSLVWGVKSTANAFQVVNGVGFSALGTSYSGSVHYLNHNGNMAQTGGVYWTAFQANTPGWAWASERRWYCIDLEHTHVSSPQNWRVFDTNDPTLDATYVPGTPPTGGVNEFNGTLDGVQLAATLYKDNWSWAETGDASARKYRRAVLQLAIWEALYDYTSGATGTWYDITTYHGQNYVNNFYTHAAVTDDMAADVYSLITTAGSYKVAGYWDDTQGLVGDQIPEPATLMLLGTGLVGLGIATYRRRRG